MKKNYIIPVVAALFFLIVFSCQKDLDHAQVEMNSSAQTAKQEFSKLNYQAQLTSVLNDTADLVWKPAWSRSYEKSADSIQYIYTPLHATGVVRESGANFPVHTLGAAKLLLIKKDGDKTSYYIQTFFSSDTVKRNQERFTDRRLEFKNFTGIMHLENIKSDEFLRYTLKNGVYENPVRSKQMALMTQSCTYETICDWTSQCNGGATVTFTISAAAAYPYAFPCPAPYVSSCQDAQWTQVRSRVKINCVTDPGTNPLPPPVPDTGGGPLTPGDNNTENVNDPNPADSNIRKIAYWCSNMTITARAAFKNGFYAWLNDDPRSCLNNYLYLSLQDPARPFKFVICINPGAPGSGAYNPSTQVLSFPNEDMASYSPVIGHELFHVYQDKFYAGGITQYSTGTRTGYSNVEFEQGLYADLAFTTNPPTLFLSAPSTLRAEYLNWINQITDNRTTFPREYSDLEGQYFYFLEKFREINPGNNYSSPSIPTLKPEAMLSIFKNSPCQ